MVWRWERCRIFSDTCDFAICRHGANDAAQGGVSDAPQTAVAAHKYSINAMVSRFTVQAFASGFLSAFGHNPKFAIRDLSGEINFDPEHIEKSTMHLVIRATSLSVTDNISDKDRREIEGEMRDKVLEIAKYPEIAQPARSDPPTESTRNGRGYRRDAAGLRRVLVATNGLRHQARLGCRRRPQGERRSQVHVRHRRAPVKLTSTPLPLKIPHFHRDSRNFCASD